MATERRNKMFDPRITITHIIATVTLLCSGVVWALNMVVEDEHLQSGINKNADSILYAQQLQQQQNKYLKESIDDLKKSNQRTNELLNELLIQEKQQ